MLRGCIQASERFGERCEVEREKWEKAQKHKASPSDIEGIKLRVVKEEMTEWVLRRLQVCDAKDLSLIHI